MVIMSYQVILQYEMEFDDKTGLPTSTRPKLTKGWIPKSLDNKKIKKVVRDLVVSSSDSIEM